MQFNNYYITILNIIFLIILNNVFMENQCNFILKFILKKLFNVIYQFSLRKHSAKAVSSDFSILRTCSVFCKLIRMKGTAAPCIAIIEMEWRTSKRGGDACTLYWLIWVCMNTFFNPLFNKFWRLCIEYNPAVHIKKGVIYKR